MKIQWKLCCHQRNAAKQNFARQMRGVRYFFFTGEKSFSNRFFCTLVYFHSRIMSNKIARLRERWSRLLYIDKKSSFEEPLQQDKSVLICTRQEFENASQLEKRLKLFSCQNLGYCSLRSDRICSYCYVCNMY